MDALATRMDAFQQETDMIQRQLDFHQKTSPSIDTRTRTSIDNQQATNEIQHASIGRNNVASIGDKNPAPYTSIREEIFNRIKMDNQWEEDALKKKLNVFYCSLDNNLNWATKRGELLQKELDFLRNKKEKQHKQPPSIDTDNNTSIDMDTNRNNGWNTEFHYKPKERREAGQIHQRIYTLNKEKLPTPRKKLKR
ncbi:hypothetical protein Rs2_15954 [Raphanus sativus]|nr:hypothetical protein Rs2_15954 [Raphanus sativus]